MGRRIFGNHIVFEGNQRRSVVTGGGGNPINLSANERGIKYIIVTRQNSSSPSLVMKNDCSLNWLRLTLHDY